MDPILTFEEMNTELTSAGAQLESAQNKYNQARQTFDYNTEAHRQAGQENYQAALGSHLPALEAAEDEVLNLTSELREKIRHIYNVTNPANAQPSLTDAEMVSAAAKEPFVKEDIAKLSCAVLLKRLQDAIAQGDKATMYLYMRHGKNRVTGANSWERADPGFNEFSRLVSSIPAQLVSNKGKSIFEQVRKVSDQAHALESQANKRRGQAKKYTFQKSTDVTWDQTY